MDPKGFDLELLLSLTMQRKEQSWIESPLCAQLAASLNFPECKLGRSGLSYRVLLRGFQKNGT